MGCYVSPGAPSRGTGDGPLRSCDQRGERPKATVSWGEGRRGTVTAFQAEGTEAKAQRNALHLRSCRGARHVKSPVREKGCVRVTAG